MPLQPSHDEVVELERRATAGARRRGETARASAIAKASLRSKTPRGIAPTARFSRRTGVSVTSEQLVAIAALPGADELPRPKRKPARIRVPKTPAELKEWQAKTGRQRGHTAGSTSVRTASGGLPGLGR
jgi:hypothetical protein